MSTATRPATRPRSRPGPRPPRSAWPTRASAAWSRPRTRARLALAGNLLRDPVRLEARSRTRSGSARRCPPSTPSSASDYRYVPKDRTAYLAYMRMRRESAGLDVWQAQQAYFSWLLRNDPLAFVVLDPVITVHPDQVLFEVFSKDEGAYAKLGIDRDALRPRRGAPTCGTTNIDFSQALYQGLQQMRSYRETRLSIGQEGVKLATAAAGEVLEKQIQRARLVAARLPPGAVGGRAAARPLPPGADRPVQRAAPPAAARRPQGPAPRAAHRAGPRRAAAAGAGAVERGDPRHGRAVQGQGRRASSASGAGAG